jgi:NADH-quinone oxidoreductase subunit N
LTLFSLAAVTGLLVSYAMTGQTIYGFDNMVVSDAMGNWLKAFAALAVMVTLVYGRAYAMDREMMRGGELFTMSLFALLGMFVMISGNNFLVIYMGIELLTLSSYALVALRRDHPVAIEAAMKYFVLGALASGFLLYGMSMLYGATGSLNLHEVFAAINTGKVDHRILVFGLVFIVAGSGVQAGCGSLSYVDTGRLSGCAYRCDAAGRWCAQTGCFCGVSSGFWSKVYCHWQWIGNKC